jgi:Na+/proline symporter/nitrogen-specific signal transduction histidine kinase
MLQGWVILVVSFGYVGLLFAIAYYGDKRADEGRSIIDNPYIYALSIAVYCTSWTFYGSVGRAATSGLDFLPIYLGPTLTFLLWWFLLRRILRISKANRITSIADFIASRYGKSTMLGGLVTVIAVVGILPYVSLQLKAVATSFTVLLHYPEVATPESLPALPGVGPLAFLIAILMALFAILFGTRHIDASEHHQGMVAAIAFESIVKLVAFLAVGVFVTYGLYDGFSGIFARAAAEPQLARLLTMEATGGYTQWVTLTILSMAAILCLPRQFQIAVVENVDERHLAKAVWLFPLYLLAINIFVLPIALSGLLHFPGGAVDADTFVLTLPIAEKQEALALLVFVGGLSAATGMLIVASIALSTMLCNDLVMPVLLRIGWLRLTERGDLSRLLLYIRRGAIVFILMSGYVYYRYIGGSYALVTIGLVSFAAAAQFAPAIIGGIFWKGATRKGALAGLSLGFAMWLYTLLLPAFARSGWLPQSFIDAGPFGVALLKPYQLFGLAGLDSLSHALFWSMLANIGGLILISIASRQSVVERVQAALFVDVYRHTGTPAAGFWRGGATVRDLVELAGRFVGRREAERAFADHARRHNLDLRRTEGADAGLVSFAERMLAGAVGASSARVMLSTVAKGEMMGIDEVMQILDETSQVIEYSRRLEEKSRELEVATAELRAAYERLQELDRLKDDFIATVSHELRTPLTSIRSFGEILADNPDIDDEERRQFLGIMVRESERLTRLIDEILDLARMEAGRMAWQMGDIDPKSAIEDALAATASLFAERDITVEVRLPSRMPTVYADRDRLIQVIVNLLSNAAKFTAAERPRVLVEARVLAEAIQVSVADNGPGIPRKARALIFEKFQQAHETLTDKPQGTGLGLPICRQIVEHFGGRIWFNSKPNKGTRFSFTVPYAKAGGGKQAAE